MSAGFFRVMHFVVGTAGHIDHGKSALVKALTGTDPDRLKEEQERGMTTDLGFAFLGSDITIIDVPGHERFVRHMLAGASTIDMVVLVVAADDGVMPQTREHFEICRLLGIKKGVVAINKIDLVDREWLEMVREDVAEMVRGSFLEGAPVVFVSARTGAGVTELKRVIGEVAKTIERRPDRGVFRLPIDRCFSVKGFGTVVAGTVLSGKCRVGDRLELLPQGIEVRVRGIQEHNHPVESAGIGERAALNLQGVAEDKVERGNVLATPGYYRPSELLNCSLYLLKEVRRPLRNMTRVHLHIGTAEVMCRVCLLDRKEMAPGTEGLVQLRTETPVVADRDDHYVLRHYAPAQTIGGGVVLEVNGYKERRFVLATIRRLEQLRSGERGAVLEQLLLKAGAGEIKTLPAIARELAITDEDARTMADFLLAQGKVVWVEAEGKRFLVHRQVREEAKGRVVSFLSEFHRENPLRLGVKRGELRVKTGIAPVLLDELLQELVQSGEAVIEDERVRLAGHQLQLSPAERVVFDRIAKSFADGKWRPPDIEEAFAGVEPKLARRVKTALLESGILVDLGEGVVVHQEALKEAERIIRELFRNKAELTASEIRQALDSTRKIVIPLLNYFDSVGITRRKGDVRILAAEHRVQDSGGHSK